jgi:glycosyltransferase involved in cell wall biosynthesis
MPGILIDVTRLTRRLFRKRFPTGVDRVCLAYIRHYRAQARAVLMFKGVSFVFRPAESAVLFDWLLSLGATGLPMAAIFKGLAPGISTQQVDGNFLFNIGHSGLESDGYIASLQRQHVRPIFMVHDLIPITHPQFCRIGERGKHLARIRNAMRVASGIVCNSQATKKALDILCTQQGWNKPPSVVALLAPDLPPAFQTFRPFEHPYFVFVSTIEPRKNHLMILRIWQKLAGQLGQSVPRLVIIGQRGWDYGPVVDLLEHSSVLQSCVTELSACSDAEMVTYIEHAQALLFPSFTEGFGMPVVEALAHGVPVIASDLKVFQEFADHIPEYVAADDEDGWAEAICHYATPCSSRREEQMQRMKGYLAPTWASHFDQVEGLLSRLNRDD